MLKLVFSIFVGIPFKLYLFHWVSLTQDSGLRHTNIWRMIWLSTEGSFQAACREFVIPAEAGIQKDPTGFPRIKYGAGVSRTCLCVSAPVCVASATGRRRQAG